MKMYTVQTIAAGKLRESRAVMADDAREAAQKYCRAEHYADVALVGPYEHAGSVAIGHVAEVGGWHYRVGARHVRVTG